MKARFRITVLFLALLAAACGQKVVKMPETPPQTTQDAQATLFSRAETYDSRQEPGNALAAYQEFVTRFPDAPRAADALMRIGAIHRAGGSFKEALDAYQRVVSEYPRSERSADALVEILYTLYDQGAYDQVITRADEVLAQPVTTQNVYRAYSVLGDAYRAAAWPEPAVRAYALAARFAPDDGARAAVLERLKAAVEGLEVEKAVSLLGYIDDPLARGYLLYRLGNGYLAAERTHEALMTLSEFVDLYPSHEFAPEARVHIDTLRRQVGSMRFVVGCLLPLTGSSAVFGVQALDGVEFALNRFHATDGAPSIELLVKDSGSDPAKAVSAVRQLHEAGAVAIIGPIFTAAEAAAEAQQLGIPMLAITQKEDVAAIGDFIFINFFTPRMQVKALVVYAVERLGMRRFAVLYPEDKYGQTFMNLFWDEVISHGASVVAAESYQTAHTDFADTIKKLAGPYTKASGGAGRSEERGGTRAVDFEGLFIPDAPQRAGLIIPQLAYNDIPSVQLFGTNLWHSEALVTMARPYVQGAIMPDIFFAGSQNPVVKTFVDEFARVYHRTPGFIEAVLYDTAAMLFQTLNQPGTAVRSSIRNRLTGISGFTGLTGVTSFGENGDAQKSLYLLQIEGGGFVELPY